MAYLETPEAEEGRDLPDNFVFLALDASLMIGVSVLVVLGLWKVEELIVGAIW